MEAADPLVLSGMRSPLRHRGRISYLLDSEVHARSFAKPSVGRGAKRR
jgi:hypothetical protein